MSNQFPWEKSVTASAEAIQLEAREELIRLALSTLETAQQLMEELGSDPQGRLVAAGAIAQAIAQLKGGQ